MTAQMHAIDLPFELSKKGTATLRKLNERTAAHEKKRPEIEQRDEELRQLELRPGSAGAFVEAARAATDARINFLLEEQQLRGDRDAFYEECESEMQAAVDKAYQEWESAQVEVRQGLISDGLRRWGFARDRPPFDSAGLHHDPPPSLQRKEQARVAQAIRPGRPGAR